MKYTIPIPSTKRDDALVAKLLRLWEDSVRASHHFLNDSDIEGLKPFVVEGIKEIPTLIVERDNGEPVAFMGISDRKIEMLFVAPTHFGRGIGKRMVTMAKREYQVAFVDANEQNLHAVEFYRHMGFEVFERSETDDQGNAFPILRLSLVSNY